MNRPTPHSAPSVPSLDVTAVVVTRGTTPFLPTTLAAVGASTLAPSRVVVVDVTPREKDRAQVPEQLGPDVAVTTLHAPDAHTFGEAVNAAIAHLTGEQVPDTGRRSQRARPAEPAAAPELERDGWLWLLHDDSPPEPGALEALVRVVENKPSVVVAGAKQRDLDDPSRLLEVGLTTSPTGVRMTGIEEGEVDQGQHDGAEDVLAVGLAGALFRLDAWRALGGTDPAYGKYGDGLEICRRARLAGHRVIVVPQAAVRHARASLTDRRDRDPDHVPEPERTVGARRRSALHYRLAGASPAAVPLHMLAILLAAPFLAMAQLAAKRPRRARAEITAAIGAVLRPVALARSRRRARRTAALPRRAITPLRATWREVAAERRDRRLSQAARRRAALAADPFARAERRRDRARRTAGLVGTVLLLTAVTVWWLGDAIGPLADGGRLVSANLLPAGVSLQELWNDVADGWLRAGTGAPGASDPLMTTLLPATALAHLLGGDLQVVVNLLLLLAPVLAGTGAWFAAGTAPSRSSCVPSPLSSGSRPRASPSASWTDASARCSRTSRCRGSPGARSRASASAPVHRSRPQPQAPTRCCRRRARSRLPRSAASPLQRRSVARRTSPRRSSPRCSSLPSFCRATAAGAATAATSPSSPRPCSSCSRPSSPSSCARAPARTGASC